MHEGRSKVSWPSGVTQRRGCDDMAFMVMKALHGEFLGDMECVGSYGRLEDAQRRMIEDIWVAAKRDDASDEAVHTWVDVDGIDYGYCDTTCAEWRIFELKSYLFSPTETKACPVCGTTLFDDMDVCYGCLHEFGKE